MIPECGYGGSGSDEMMGGGHRCLVEVVAVLARLEFGVLRWKVTGVTGLGGAWMSAMDEERLRVKIIPEFVDGYLLRCQIWLVASR